MQVNLEMYSAKARQGAVSALTQQMNNCGSEQDANLQGLQGSFRKLEVDWLDWFIVFNVALGWFIITFHYFNKFFIQQNSKLECQYTWIYCSIWVAKRWYRWKAKFADQMTLAVNVGRYGVGSTDRWSFNDKTKINQILSSFYFTKHNLRDIRYS